MALASEVDRRARRTGKGVVLILAGEADGIAAARRLCPALDAVLPQPVVLPDFTAAEVVQLVDGRDLHWLTSELNLRTFRTHYSR